MNASHLISRLLKYTKSTSAPTLTTTQIMYNHNNTNYKRYKKNILIGTIIGTTSTILCYSGLYCYNLVNDIELLFSR